MATKKQGKRRPASYYIDFENVRGAGLDGVEALGKGDRVTVLYGSKDSALKLEQVQNILNSPAKVDFIKVATGKHDALDFQLVALLFMKMKKKRDYYIVSKDTGFDFAIRMAKVRGMGNVYRRETISGATLQPKQLPQGRRKPAKRLPQPKDAAQQQQQQRDPHEKQNRPKREETPKPQVEPDVPKREEAPKSQVEPAALQQDVPQQDAPQQDPPKVDVAAPVQAPVPPTTPETLPAQAEAPQAAPLSKSARRRRRKATRLAQEQKDPRRSAIEELLAKQLGAPLEANKVDAIISGLEKCDTKARFYNHLRGTLGNDQGLALYRDVKGSFDQLRALVQPVAEAPKPVESPES